jgi:hypothetical protein
MHGVCTYRKPFWLKNVCVAYDSALRMRATAAMARVALTPG